MDNVFQHAVPDTLWAHLVECWSHGFNYTEAISYSFNFTPRLFSVAMQAMDDDYDAYLYEHYRAVWRQGFLS